MKRFLSLLVVLALVLAMVPAAFAEATELTSETDLSLIADANGTTYDWEWTATSDGTVTVSITEVNPGIKFWFGDNLPKTATAAKSFDFEVTSGTTYAFKIYGYENWANVNATVSYVITFTPAEGSGEGGGEVEKAESIVSETALVLGDNPLTLDATAVTTIYAFEPTEVGKYTFTAPEGAVVGYWGAGSWFLTNPNSTTNSCEWECTGVGQSAYIGVSGVEGEFVLSVAKTGEYVDTSIQYEEYENTHTPAAKYTSCYTIDDTADTTPTTTPVRGDDGFYYVDDQLAVVDFASSKISISAMLGTGAAKYVVFNEDGSVKEAYDYTNALLEYTAAAAETSKYPMTDDLYVMIPNVVAAKGWVESGYITSWLDLVNVATVSHTEGEAVAEDGYNNVYCTVCDQLLSSEASIIDIYYNGANVDVSAGNTANCNLYFRGSMIMTVTGEGYFTVTYDGNDYAAVDGVVTIPGVTSDFYAPAAMQITNNSTVDATYKVAFSLPVGTWDNPAELNTTDWNGNTATIAEGSQGYYFTWTAPVDGELVLTMADTNTIGWQISASATGADYVPSMVGPILSDGEETTLTLTVEEGDVVQVIANTYDPESTYVAPAGEVVFDAAFTAKPGSETNPFYIDDTNPDTTAVLEYPTTVPAGETYYYHGYGLSGTTLTFAAENVTVTVDGIELTAVEGVYTYEVPASSNPRMPSVITIANNGTEDAALDLNFYYPAGTANNPADLQIGTQVADIDAGSGEYYYEYVAICNGTLTVAPSGEGWIYTVSNLGDPDDWNDDLYGDMHWSDDDPVVASETIEVKTGDVVEIKVCTYDPNSWENPAGSVTVTASFEHAAIEHTEAVAPKCHENGNIEYWYCPDCDSFFQDEACTQLTNAMNIVVFATGSENLEHTEAVPATCHDRGNVEYWYCPDCDRYFLDEACTQLTNAMSIWLGELGSENIKHVEAVDPTCNRNGNIEYWYCEDCGRYFQDEACTQLTNAMNVVLGASSEYHDLQHYEAVEPGCHSDGCSEFWYCSICDTFFTKDADGNLQNTNPKNVIIPATGSENLEHNEAVEPTCHDRGVVEHWYCPDCDRYFLDEACTQLTNAMSIYLPETGSENVVHVAAKDPTTEEEGNVEYWYCPDCDRYFLDEACTQLTNAKSVIIAKVTTPVTGDNTSVIMLVSLLVVSAMGIAAVVFTKKRRAA